MSHKKRALLFLGLSVVLFIVALVMGVRALTREPEPVTQQIEQTEQSQPQEKKSGWFSRLFGGGREENTATAEPSATPQPTPTAWPGPEISEQAVLAGSDYFDNAAFLGNEMMDSLMMYDYEDVLPDDESHWFWDDDLTVLESVPYAEKMKDGSFGKIYICFGTHEMNYDSSTLREGYDMLLDQLERDHPGAVLYLVSAPPVSLWKSSNSSSQTRELVQSFNAMLKEIATERKVWYLNVYSSLCNEEGYLPSDVTNDGVHFNPAHFESWYDTMQRYYIPSGTAVPAAAPAGSSPGAAENGQAGESVG